MLQRFKQALKNDLIAGLLVVIPLATTIWLTYTIATWVIDFLTQVPKQLNPFQGLQPVLVNFLNLWVGLTVPLAFVLLIGLMARNLAGRWLLDTSERILQAIPLAGALYKILKQLLETLLRDSGDKFRQAVLVEYPRSGVWAIGFVTGAISPVIQANFSEPMLNLFIPKTPNPTAGWYAIVPERDVINLAIPIEEAFKMVVSGGIVNPETLNPGIVNPEALNSQAGAQVALKPSTAVPLDLPAKGTPHETALAPLTAPEPVALPESTL
jgi:uncharacterized membrane protein